MYTLEQINRLRTDLESLENLEKKLLTLNKPDARITVRIEIESRAYSFTVLSNNEEHIRLLKNDIAERIACLKGKIDGTQIIHIDAY